MSSKEVPELLGVQVIGEIPEILTAGEVKKKRLRGWIAGFTYGFVVIIAGGVTYMILQQPSITVRGTNTLAGLLGW